jgi:hypothetical protein
MLNPAVPLTPEESLYVLRRIVVDSSVSTEPPANLRYERDGARRSPRFRRADQWQRPEQTDQLRRGDCEDLAMRWAVWVGRKRPIHLCIARTGLRNWHYFLREVDGSILDPSVRAGMPPMNPRKYTQEVYSVLLTPEMFQQPELGSGVSNAQAAQGFGVASQVAGATAGALAVVYPPAGAAAGAIAAGLGVVSGLFGNAAASDARRKEAKRARREAARRAAADRAAADQAAKEEAARAQRRQVTARILSAKPARIRLALQRRDPQLAQQTSNGSIAKAQAALALVAAMQSGSPKATRAVLSALRRPVADPAGKPDESAIAVRLALAQVALSPGQLDIDPEVAAVAVAQPKASEEELLSVELAELDDQEDEQEEIDAEGSGGACCAECAARAVGEEDEDGEGDEDEIACALGACGAGDEDDGEGDDEDEGGEGDEDEIACASGACGAGDEDDGEGDEDEDGEGDDEDDDGEGDDEDGEGDDEDEDGEGDDEDDDGEGDDGEGDEDDDDEGDDEDDDGEGDDEGDDEDDDGEGDDEGDDEDEDGEGDDEDEDGEGDEDEDSEGDDEDEDGEGDDDEGDEDEE